MNKQTLSNMSLKQLAEIYNQHADKKIKAFSGKKEDAVARVLAVLPKEQKAAKAGTTKGDRPKVGSGAFIREKLLEGKLSPAEIIEAVHKNFPTSRATVKDVAWHKNKLKEAGEI